MAGTDGPTDATGAVVDGGTVAAALVAGLDPVAALANNDSNTLFRALDRASGASEEAGCTVVTGPTGTNVMDIVVGLASWAVPECA